MLKKSWIVFLLISAVMISACAPDPAAVSTLVAQTVAAISTATPYPSLTPAASYTPLPTYTPAPTYTKQPTLKPIVITATSSPTPKYTPTETAIPSPTLPANQKSRKDGIYLVGDQIAPGVWDSDGSGDSCYWEVTTKTGDIIDNHFGLAGGTMYVPESGFQVSVRKCGQWVYLGP